MICFNVNYIHKEGNKMPSALVSDTVANMTKEHYQLGIEFYP
jgi:hypothetical protein